MLLVGNKLLAQKSVRCCVRASRWWVPESFLFSIEVVMIDGPSQHQTNDNHCQQQVADGKLHGAPYSSRASLASATREMDSGLSSMAGASRVEKENGKSETW